MGSISIKESQNKERLITAMDGTVKGEAIMQAFHNSEFEKHNTEAKEKWGQIPAYREYEAKTKDYSKEKWDALAQGMDQILAAFARCMETGEMPDSAGAQALVKTLQTHITEHYYLCTKEMLSGLGQMYVADERFKNNIDQHGAGTAQFICDGINAYCQQ